MAECHHCNGQKSVFLVQSPEFAQMSIKDLEEIVNQGSEWFGELLGKMNAYNTNINGSNRYLYQSRKNLEALIDQEGMTSMWFSFLAANNHWAYMHQTSHRENDTHQNDEINNNQEDKESTTLSSLAIGDTAA
jgi:hypothetical protein